MLSLFATVLFFTTTSTSDLGLSSTSLTASGAS
jgi:hypothetical protein